MKEKTLRILSWIWKLLSKVLPAAVLSILDWLTRVVERAVVLAIAFAVFYFFWHIIHGNQSQVSSAEHALEVCSQNWKGLLILLVPLFYRTIRTFLEKVRRAWGMEVEAEKRSPESEKGE